jgi:hypothetical protein
MQLAGDGVFGPPRDRDEALRVAVAPRVDHIDTAQCANLLSCVAPLWRITAIR